jgi:hypothetical protein
MLTLLTFTFFAVSGFMLNHDEWFGVKAATTHTKQVVVPAGLLKEPDKLGVVEFLRSQGQAQGAMISFEARPDDTEIRVVFQGPGRRSEAVIEREDGQTEITTDVQGLAGILGDLHKSDNAGTAWKIITDGTAIVLLLASLTGLLLFISLPKRRVLGLIALGVGVGLCVGVYVLCVP